MLFNVEKCEVMHIGYDNVQADYAMNDVKLVCVQGRRQEGGGLGRARLSPLNHGN